LPSWASAAIGLLVASLIVPGMEVRPLGFVVAVVIFAALILASLFSGGLSIRGLGSWVAATVVVWLVTALAALILASLLLEQKVTGSGR